MSTPYEQLSAESREKLERWAVSQRQLLAELLEDAGTDLQREFLDRAIAAGHTPAEVHAFADELRGMEDDEAFGACTLDADAPEGYTVNQLLRAEADPLYAYELKGGNLSPADEAGGDPPVTTELTVETEDADLAPSPGKPSPDRRGRTDAPRPPGEVRSPPGAASPAPMLSVKDLAPPGTMSPGGTPRPKDLAPAGSMTPGGTRRPAPADTQPHPAFKPPIPGVIDTHPQPAHRPAAGPGPADTHPQPAFRPPPPGVIADTGAHAAFRPPLAGTTAPAPADTQPHAAFKPASKAEPGLQPGSGAPVPFRPPPPGVAVPGTGVTPAFKPDASRELGGSAIPPSGKHRPNLGSSGGLPMSPRDSGAPPVPARLLARELGASADAPRSRGGGSSPSLNAVPVANKLCEDALTEACRPFGLSFRECDVDLDGGATLEQALEQAATALGRGVMVPVCLGPQPGQHRRFAVLMQLSVVGANRAWQLYEMTTQELAWANEGDLIARKELPFSNKANRRITRLALPNIKASDF